MSRSSVDLTAVPSINQYAHISLLFWGLCALWFGFTQHFFMHNPGGAGLYLPFNTWGWIFASLMIGIGLWHATSKGELVVSPLLLLWGLAVVLMWLPITWSDNALRDYALPRLGGLTGGWLFLLALYQFRLNRDDRQRFISWLLIAVAIEMTLGLVQYYLLTPGNWLGYDTAVNRPYGIFQQPNVMASFMATGLALALWMTSWHRQGWLKWLQAYVMIGAVILLVVLQSRTGQLGAGLALLFMLPWLKQQKRLRWAFCWILLGFFIGIISLYFVDGMKRGFAVYQSEGYRAIYWPYALKLWWQHPFSGWGYGSFETVFLHNYMSEKALNPAMPQIEYNLDHPHNELLYWAVEGGILPVVGFVIMGIALLLRVKGEPFFRAMALLSLIVPIVLHTQTEYPLYHSIVHWIFLLILVWYIDAVCGSEVEAEAGFIVWPCSHKLLLRFLAIGIPLLVVPFMLTALHTAWVVTKYERGGYKEPILLLDIVNPMAWLTRVEFDVNSVRLMIGLQTNNKAELQAYLEWGEAFVRHTPRANIYANMVIALNALGRIDEANRLRGEAIRIYPTEPLLRASATTTVTNSIDQTKSTTISN